MQCFAVWAAAVFQVRQVSHACFFLLCVVLGSMEQELFVVFQLVDRLEGFSKVCLCFDGLFCFCGMLLGV